MKSGTTVLYEFICEHPNVAAASEKEIHFFSLVPFRGSDWYLSHFTPNKGQITGEASPTYFHVANTPALPMSIKEFAPDIKLILIIRDPVERAISHFFHYVTVNKIEKLEQMGINRFFERNFESGLKQTSDLDYYMHDILSFSCYTRKYLTFVKVFGRENILVLNNSDLVLTPQKTMNKTFTYLGLEPITSSEFSKFRYSTGSSVNALHPELLKKLGNFLYPDFKQFCALTGIYYNPLHLAESTAEAI